MTREAIEYFKYHRKIFCEDHLKICPKDSIAYRATLKEKEFYDMAIKALEQEPKFIAKSDGTIEQIIKFTMKEDKEMELRDTVAMMESEDYKERFKAEYYQTKIRYNKLHKMTIKYEAGKLDFEPSCPLRLLLEQKRCMGAYLHALEVRAQIEGIDLEEAQA